MSIEQKLQEIDLQLEVMPEQNRKMLYASIFIGVVAFIYYFFGAALAEEVGVKEEKLLALQKQLAENKISLYEAKIQKEQKRILFLAQEQQTGEYAAKALRMKLERMDYLSSDAKGMADILERILKNSVVLGVNIEKISLDNTQSSYAAQIEKRGAILIEGEAPFHSVLKLLRFIESQEALIEIENVKFDLKKSSSSPDFSITITGYGIRL